MDVLKTYDYLRPYFGGMFPYIGASDVGSSTLTKLFQEFRYFFIGVGFFAFCVAIVFHCSHRKSSVGWIRGHCIIHPFFERVAYYCLNTEPCCFQFGKSNFFVHSTRYTIIQEFIEVFKSRTVRLDFISRRKTCRASDAPLGMIFPRGGHSSQTFEMTCLFGCIHEQFLTILK